MPAASSCRCKRTDQFLYLKLSDAGQQFPRKLASGTLVTGLYMPVARLYVPLSQRLTHVSSLCGALPGVPPWLVAVAVLLFMHCENLASISAEGCRVSAVQRMAALGCTSMPCLCCTAHGCTACTRVHLHRLAACLTTKGFDQKQATVGP